MANQRRFPLCAVVIALLCSTALTAQRFAPTVRIVNRVDESSLATLKGNTLPVANARNDRGLVSPSLPMTDLILVLSRDSAQQAAFEKFVASQYDANSPNYHQWLAPDQVGANFGPSETDIATVSNWLTGHGFTINEVTKDRMSIRFSGNAAQVQGTFHTEIHNLVVNGVAHIANMSDPQIPEALTPVVVGIKSLHNFFPRPLHHLGSLVTKDSKTGGWLRTPAAAGTVSNLKSAAAPPAAGSFASKLSPQFGITGTSNGTPYLVEDIGPYDFATIYNVAPLWNAGIDGSGQTIAIAGTSSIVPNDIATFRNFFLPSYTSTPAPTIISGNSSPLTVCTDTTGNLPFPTAPCTIEDLIENSLDVEWSGAVAPKAQIVLVASYPSSATDDNLYDSESYIVNHLTAHIMNVSYGECELFNGTAGNVQYYNLWQTAAAEGIAVFVATGDSGSASCDAGGDAGGSKLPYAAEFGLSVSGLASTPYNTAVGGTDFNWCSLTATSCTAAPYWSTTNTTNANAPESSALGYVPEVPWNDTCTSSVATAWMVSYWKGFTYLNNSNAQVSVTDAETGCNAFIYYATQLSQQGDGSILYLVDTVGGSGGASGCVANSTTSTTLGACTAGATSTGATTNPDTGASQASLPLSNNGWAKPTWQTGVTGIPSDGVRDIPDVSFFASDGFLSGSAYLVCVSDATVDSQCAYSSTTEPTALEVGGTSVATPAMAGVMALINQKTGAAQGSPNTELYKLASQQTYSSCSAETVTVGSTSCYFNDVDQGTNAMPCDYSYLAATPSPNCTLQHSGDYVGILPGYSAGTGYDLATGLGSLNVYNVVHAWPAIQGTAAATVTVLPAQSSINSSNSLGVTVTVASNPSGGATPTGSVTLSASSPSTYSATQSLSSAGSTTFTIPPDSLGAGTATLTGKYSGDVLYAAATNTAQVTVTTPVLLTPTITVTPASTTVSQSASLGVTGSVSGTGITPTGTVTLSTGSYTSSAVTLASGAYSFTGSSAIPANTLTSGSNTIKVSYSGDVNYAAGSNTATVTATQSTFTLTTPAIVVSPTTIAPGASATATVAVAASGGYLGTVTLSCAQTSTTASGGDGASCTGGGTAQTVTLSSTATTGTVTFTVTTAAKVGALVYPNVNGKSRTTELAGLGGGALLTFLVFLGIPARRRSWRQMLGILVLIAALGGLSSCGGGSVGGGGGTTDPGTTAGTYTFTVTATGTPTVTPAVSTTFTVTVN
jgi:Pro-kumamolisin, activation domain